MQNNISINDLLAKYENANSYLNKSLIRTSLNNNPSVLTRREWMIKFLDALGHPEVEYPVIHIAGTSGKGSTAKIIAEILRSAGYSVGLHVTPYLQVATEKLWVNRKYASINEFHDLVEWVKPICERWRSPDVPLHGLASFGICLEHFRRKKIDIAVIETGVGGRNDITNVTRTLLSVITPIGLDHVKTLGNNIESIAHHKAGIIKEGASVVAYKGDGHNILAKEAADKGAPLKWVTNHSAISSREFYNEMSRMRGINFINTSIALAATEELRTLRYNIGNNDIKAGISRGRLPGRLEEVQSEPRIIIDGAHNEQKIEGTIKSLKCRPGTLVFGSLSSKMTHKIVERLSGKFEKIILTSPQVYGKESKPPEELKDLFDRINHTPIYKHELKAEPKEALMSAVNSAGESDSILVTGSLYLAGNVRDYFYRPEDILFARSSWPKKNITLTNRNRFTYFKEKTREEENERNFQGGNTGSRIGN